MRLKWASQRVDPQCVPEQRPIDRAFFREAEDGTTVFFPWGLPHRGYLLTDPGARKKASRAVSFMVTSTIAIGAWIAHAFEPLLESEAMEFNDILGTLVARAAVLLLVIASYSVWVSRFVERFPESSLKVSREERLREAAEVVEPWKVTLIGVITCGLSALLIYLEPRVWWLGVLGVVLGAGMLSWSSLLRRASAEPSR
jgi:hypothetical protein